VSAAIQVSTCALIPEEIVPPSEAERGKTEAMRRKVLSALGKLLLWIAPSTKKMRQNICTGDFGGASLLELGAM